MIDTVLESEEGRVIIKVNSRDWNLCEVLQERQFEKKHKDVSVLELDLNRDLKYEISDEYFISPQDMDVDKWQ